MPICQAQVQYLGHVIVGGVGMDGHVIVEGGVGMDGDKVDAIAKWPQPRATKVL